MAKKAEKTENTKKRKRRGVVRSVLRGRIVSTGFLRRYRAWIALVMFFALTYIYVRYECMTTMENIQKLEKQLDVARTERIREKSRYMSDTRESSLNERLAAKGIKLKVADRPPYKLHLKK